MATNDSKYKLDSRFPIHSRRSVEPETIQHALQAYESGRYLDAWKHVERVGPMQSWSDVSSQIFGCRLAGNMGASRLSALLIRRAFRSAPADPQVAVHYGYHLQGTRGLISCWRHALASEVHTAQRPDMLADLKAMRAQIAGTYRDFDTAWRLWNEAHELDPDSAWLRVEKASVLLSQERREEALAAIDESLALRPWYRPAVQHKGRILHLLGHWEEAIQFLTEANSRLQSFGVASQLLSLKREVDDHAGMSELADHIDSLSVIAEKAEREWLLARRADISCLAGDYPAAAAAAEKVGGDYYPALAGRLRQPGLKARRVRLPFEFVHQKHNTCAPATLAAVAQFWRRPITMEQIVDAICYDGTQDYAERIWALANGFAVREFTITLASAKLLIDAGVPIVLTTVEVGSAHSQALIGYDDVRQSLFIQDPSEPHYREAPAQEFLDAYKLTGPRGLVLLQQERAGWLAAQPLPDVEMYDLNHRFSTALAEYDRAAAVLVLHEMKQLDATHRLVLMAQLSLAAFDGNDVERGECLQRLLEVFPDDQRLLNWKVTTLRGLGRSEERLQLLRGLVRGEKCQPWSLRMLGEELLEDARSWPEARRILRRAHAASPGDATTLLRLADLMRRSQEGAAEDCLTVYRFAAAMSDKVEGYAQMWFTHATSQGRTEEALEWLRRRMRDYGKKSGAPALTLIQALDTLGRPEMVDVAHEAVSLRPDDGDLLLELARLKTRLGHFEEATSLLQRAEGKTPPASWQRAMAMLLRRRDGPAAELQMWRQILEREPLALDAHQSVARELAGGNGNMAAVTHLQSVVSRFPHHYGLGQLLVQWQHDTDAALALPQLQRMIELHPFDPWAHREQALVLRELGRHDEALRAARQALALAPDQAAGHAILGVVLISLAQGAEAAEVLRQGIRLDVNYAYSFEALFQIADTTDRQRAELAFIRGEMIRQVLSGAGLHGYRTLAAAILDPHELHEELVEVWKARPDLWEAWSVLIQQKIDLGARDEALQLASDATVRFALTPAAWKDLATVQRHAGDLSAAMDTMRRVTQMNPDWPDGWLLLAEYQEDAGQAAAATGTLRRGAARLPLNIVLRGSLANLLWRTEARDEAWSLAEKTALEDPGQEWAWGCLKNWAEVLQRQDRLLELGRSLTRLRPRDARAWMMLARLLPIENIQEMLTAIDRALEIDPRHIDAYDLRAEMLARLGRVDEAEASLKTGPWQVSELPYVLCGRAAWLQAVRGDTVGAIRRMKVVLDTHQNYYWGWKMLSAWAEQRTDMLHWRKAAQEMIRLNPRSADPYNTAADAELHGGKRVAGIRHLRHALHVEPGDAYAAHRLLGLFWEARDIPALTEAAQGLVSHGTVGLIRRVYLMLAAAQHQDLAQVRADLEWLATQPDMLGPLLDIVQKFFQGHNRKLHELLGEVVNQVADENRIGPAFAILWVQIQHLKRNWSCWRQLASWMPRLGSRLVPAVATYLDFIGDSRAADPHLSQFVQECGPFLRERGELWGKVSYAFANSGLWRACADWLLPDYRRADAEGWMLSNLAISLHELGDREKAVEVSRHAISQGLHDNTWPMHVALAAHGAAVSGEYEEAQRLAKLDGFQGPNSQWSLLAFLADLEGQVMSQPPARAKLIFTAALTPLKSRMTGLGLSEWAQRDVEAAIERMRAHAGVRFMPWNRPKTARASSSSGSGSHPWLIWVMIMVALQVIRACFNSNNHSSFSPPPLPRTSVPSLPSSPDLSDDPMNRVWRTAPTLSPTIPGLNLPPPVDINDPLLKPRN